MGNGNPRLIRIRAWSSQDKVENVGPIGLRVSGQVRCDETSCPINIEPSPASWIDRLSDDGSSSIRYSPWPWDGGALNQYDKPKALATFVQEGWTGMTFYAGMTAMKDRSQCGCAGKDRAAAHYDEAWNLLFWWRSNTATVGNSGKLDLTITVDAPDVCNEHGSFNKATGKCECHANYTRGADSCAGSTSYMTPCCLACPTSPHPILGELNCTDVVLETGGATEMKLPEAQTWVAGEPTVPGTIPTHSIVAFPGERLLTHIPSIPLNPSGNPGLISWQFHLSHTPQMNWHVGGVHTC